MSLSANLYAAPASIPSNFHGLWATEESCRQMNKEGIDRPYVDLNKSQINFPLSSCVLKSVKKSDAQTFAGQFTCREDEGEVNKSTIEVSLDSAAKLSVKGKDNLVGLKICKLKNRK